MAVGVWPAVLAVAALATAGFAGQAEVSRDVPVTSTDLRVQAGNNTPVLAADPTDPRFVVMANRIDSVRFGCRLHASGDGGRSWLPVPTLPDLPDDIDHCYAPQVVFDGQGRLHVLLVGLAGPGNRPVGVYLASSGNRARTFSQPRQILGANSYQVRLAIDRNEGDPGRLYLVWLHATAEPSLGSLPPPPNPILAAHSDDGGRTWSDPVRVSDPARDLVVAPALAVGTEGGVHVAYYDLGRDRRDYHGLEGPVWDGRWSLVHTRSTDVGQSFEQGRAVTDAIAPPARVMLIFTMPGPALATVEGGGLVAAWPDARHGDPDVLAARSADAGTTWQGPIRVNDDPVGNGATQLLPALAAAGGRVDALWLDRRADPEQDIATHVRYATSIDGGATFAPSLRLTTRPSDARAGARYPIPSAAGLVEWGSGLGLLAGQHRVVAAWPDTRHVPPGMGQQDIFAATLTHPASGPAPWAALAAVLTLAAGGALVAVLWGRRAARPGGPGPAPGPTPPAGAGHAPRTPVLTP